MKSLFILAIAIVAFSFTPNQQTFIHKAHPRFSQQYQAKTIIIKDARFNDSKTYFQNIKELSFEVYQLTDLESNNLIAQCKKLKDVKNIVLGTKTGNYQQIVMTLSKSQNQKWFTQQFLSAGMKYLLINHDEVVILTNK